MNTERDSGLNAKTSRLQRIRSLATGALSKTIPQQRTKSSEALRDNELGRDTGMKISINIDDADLRGTISRFSESGPIPDTYLRFVPDDEVRILTRKEYDDIYSHVIYYAENGMVYTQEVVERIMESGDSSYLARPSQHVTQGDLMTIDQTDRIGVPAGSAIVRLRHSSEFDDRESELQDAGVNESGRYRSVLLVATDVSLVA